MGKSAMVGENLGPDCGLYSIPPTPHFGEEHISSLQYTFPCFKVESRAAQAMEVFLQCRAAKG